MKIQKKKIAGGWGEEGRVRGGGGEGGQDGCEQRSEAFVKIQKKILGGGGGGGSGVGCRDGGVRVDVNGEVKFM